MEEIWKPILFAPDYYISSNGRVKSTKFGKEILLSQSQVSDSDPRLKVKIYINGKRKTLKVHRLMMMTFCPIGHPELYEVNHKDGNPQNNHLDNLEWVSSKENHNHYRDILIPQRKKEGTFKVGVDKSFYKIEFTNGIINYYEGYESIQKDLGVSPTTISRWRNGQYPTYIASIEKVLNIPDGWKNTKVEIPKQRKRVHIEYYKKPEEVYENCKEADIALGLTTGTINRWAKRDWNKTNNGQAEQLGIKKVWKEE